MTPETLTHNVKSILGKHILADGFDFVMDMEKSHGSTIVNQSDGKSYLDMFSMYASASVGYNHPYICENADWLGKLATFKPTLSDVYPKEYADFMEVFERVAIPKELGYCFFIEGGALAVENALKAAFDWKTKLNRSRNSNKEASKVIHFTQAFHGRSGYTLSLTNTADPRKYALFPKFDWPRIHTPKIEFPITEENTEKTLEAERRALLNVEEALLTYKDEVACIIIEPIQAEGGDNHFRAEFFRELRRIADQNEVLLIFDEVQTGMGLTGKMWAYEHFGVVPDIISFGKKTQVCGIFANKEKMDIVPDNVFRESSRINSTFGGNFLDMMRLKLILEIYEKENLVQNAAQNGAYLLEELQKLQEKHPHFISKVRGRGLMCAFSLPDGAKRDAFVQAMFKKGVIILGCGTESIRFRPNMNVTKEELQTALKAIDEVATENKA